MSKELVRAKESSHTAMLSKTETDFLLPTKLGVVKYSGEENKVKIKYFVLIII